MNFIKFYADSRPIAREKFVFKVQSANIVSHSRQVLLPGSRGLHPPTKTDVFAGPGSRDDKGTEFRVQLFLSSRGSNATVAIQ